MTCRTEERYNNSDSYTQTKILMHMYVDMSGSVKKLLLFTLLLTTVQSAYHEQT